MKLSQKTEYAIRALVYLAECPHDARCSIQEIAQAEQLSFAFLEKIFAELKKAGIVTAYRGPAGGYALLLPIEKISLRMIIEALEGEIKPFESLVVQDKTPKMHCKSHLMLSVVQKKIQDSFDTVTLQDLIYTH